MFRKQVMSAAAVAVAVAVLAPAASADECLGLDCPGVTPLLSSAHGPVESKAARDLERERTSGFYDFGLQGPTKTRAVAYVVVPGEWGSMPDEIRQLPATGAVTPRERVENTIVFYGPGVVVSVPPAGRAVASRNASSKKKSRKARSAAFSDCVSGWFCLFDSENGQGAKGSWQTSIGSWQSLWDFGWGNRAESMNNRRNAWTLLSREPGGAGGTRYCAQPNSQDGTFTNNGSYQNNAEGLYNSASSTFHSEWNCVN